MLMFDLWDELNAPETACFGVRWLWLDNPWFEWKLLDVDCLLPGEKLQYSKQTHTHMYIYIYIIIHFNIMFSDFLAFNGLPISKLIHCDLILKSFLITRRCHHGFHGNLAWFASNHRPNIFLWLSRNNSDLIIWFHNHVYLYICICIADFYHFNNYIF